MAPNGHAFDPGIESSFAVSYRIATDPSIDDGKREFLRKFGVCGVISVPIALNNRGLGFVSLHLTDDLALRDDTLAILDALGRQAALALHMTCLASEAREAVLARERETAAQARAEKLAQANRALRSTYETLRSTADFDPFFGHVLATMVQHMGAPSGTAWVVDEQERGSRLHWIFERGELIPGRESSHPNAALPLPHADTFHAWERYVMEHGPKPQVSPPGALSGVHNYQRRYLAELGVVQVVALPMVVANRIVGFFCSRLHSDEMPPREDLELVSALANQATVALELTKLGQQARFTKVDLTPREFNVLRLLAKGMSNRAIGLDLHISEGTVKVHVNHLLEKLGASSRTEAAAIAAKRGLVRRT